VDRRLLHLAQRFGVSGQGHYRFSRSCVSPPVGCVQAFLMQAMVGNLQFAVLYCQFAGTVGVTLGHCVFRTSRPARHEQAVPP
jgi:hypothetical protein